MQFRSRFFDLLFNLAQSKTVSPTLIPIDFIVDDMKVKSVIGGNPNLIKPGQVLTLPESS